MEFEPCLISSCRATGPHQHPLLAEGTFGPPRREDEERTGTMEQPHAEVVSLHHRCTTCGAEGYRPLLHIAPRPLPPEPILRPCERCTTEALRLQREAWVAERAQRGALQAPRRVKP